MHDDRVIASTIGVLALVLAIGGCGQLSPEAKKAKHLERGQAYFEKGQFQEALIEFKNVVQIDPKDANGHYRLALTYLKIGGLPGLQGAFDELTRTVELDPSHRDAQLKLGELYLLASEPAKARERADLILASAPQDKEGLILRGQSLIREKEFDQGIAELKKAIELDPKNIRVYIGLALAYMQKRDVAAAEAILQQALSVDPRSSEARLALGDFFILTRKPDRAEAEYKHARDLEPDNEMIILKLAEYYKVAGKWPEAEVTYQQLVEKRPKDEKPVLILADFYKFLGHRDEALATYQRAIGINPASIPARNKLIDYYLDIGQLAEAEHLSSPILEKNKKDLDGRFYDARLRLARGKADEAIELLQGVLKDEPQSAPAHYFLGLAFARINDLAQARRELTEAVKVTPNFAEARTALAATHLAGGSPDLAIEEAQAALRLNPRNIQAAIILGEAYFRKHDLVKSKQVFETFVKVLPNEALGYYRLGLIERGDNKPREALAHFEEALKKDPNFVDALSQIVEIKAGQGKLMEARERVGRQLTVVPSNALIHNMMGILWMQAKDMPQAEASFKKAIELDSAMPVSYLNLAQLYVTNGQTDQAIQQYETALSKNPQLTPALTLLGLLYEQRHEYDKAQARYEAALKVNRKFAPAANNLAWILAERGGNLDVALGYAEVAHEQLPEEPHISDTLGWIYYKKHAFLKASSLLKEAAAKLPDNPTVQQHYRLAQEQARIRSHTE